MCRLQSGKQAGVHLPGAHAGWSLQSNLTTDRPQAQPGAAATVSLSQETPGRDTGASSSGSSMEPDEPGDGEGEGGGGLGELQAVARRRGQDDLATALRKAFEPHNRQLYALLGRCVRARLTWVEVVLEVWRVCDLTALTVPLDCP